MTNMLNVYKHRSVVTKVCSMNWNYLQHVNRVNLHGTRTTLNYNYVV